MVECAVCYQEIFAKVLAVSKAGVCKMYEQVSQGAQLWMCLLQLGVSLVQGEIHRIIRSREQRCAVKRCT